MTACAVIIAITLCAAITGFIDKCQGKAFGRNRGGGGGGGAHIPDRSDSLVITISLRYD